MKVFLVVLVAVGTFIVAVSFFGGSPEMRAFQARRAAWHQKCDTYRQTPLATSVMARACNDELNTLTAYATQQGWK